MFDSVQWAGIMMSAKIQNKQSWVLDKIEGVLILEVLMNERKKKE